MTFDDNHKYEEIIADAYLENGSFALSDFQRESAYAEYVKARQ